MKDPAEGRLSLTLMIMLPKLLNVMVGCQFNVLKPFRRTKSEGVIVLPPISSIEIARSSTAVVGHERGSPSATAIGVSRQVAVPMRAGCKEGLSPIAQYA